MSQSCSVCVHEEVTSINEALRHGGASLRLLEERYGPSRSALSRHLSHLDGGVSPPHDAPPAAVAAVPLEPLPSVTRLRTCDICMLPDASFMAIETALAREGPTPSVAEEHGVGLSALAHHVTHRQSEALSRERYEREQARAQAAAAMEAPPPASPALAWDELMHLSVQLHRQIEYGNNSAALVFAMRNVGKLLPQLVAAMAQACGQACPVPPGLLLPTFRPGDLPPHADWQMRGRDEASNL
jgi:hypothetical protein